MVLNTVDSSDVSELLLIMAQNTVHSSDISGLRVLM